jgi:hypothetical protein
MMGVILLPRKTKARAPAGLWGPGEGGKARAFIPVVGPSIYSLRV